MESVAVKTCKKQLSMVEVLIRNQKKAAQLSQKIGKPASLEAVATSTGQAIQRADSLRFGNPTIPNVGNEPKVVGAASNKAWQGKPSDAIAGNIGVFVVKSDAPYAAANPAADIELQRQFAQQNLRRQISQRALYSLRKGATIKDYRGDF